jgi:hypothetical protein
MMLTRTRQYGAKIALVHSPCTCLTQPVSNRAGRQTNRISFLEYVHDLSFLLLLKHVRGLSDVHLLEWLLGLDLVVP